MTKKWTIKEIAQKTHLSEDTIRYYEKEQLIDPQRGVNNYRLYDQKDLARLKYISVMKYAHFSLKEMKELLNLFDHPVSLDCNNRSREFLANKVRTLETTIQHYQMIIHSIQSLPIPETYEECKTNYDQMKREIAEFADTIFFDLHN